SMRPLGMHRGLTLRSMLRHAGQRHARRRARTAAASPMAAAGLFTVEPAPPRRRAPVAVLPTSAGAHRRRVRRRARAAEPPPMAAVGLSTAEPARPRKPVAAAAPRTFAAALPSLVVEPASVVRSQTDVAAGSLAHLVPRLR